MSWHWALGPDWTMSLHRLLLRIGAHAPDGLVLRARRWLTEGREIDVAQALGFAALAGQLILTESDLKTLMSVMASAGHDTSFLATLPVRRERGPVPFVAAPSPGSTAPGPDLTSVAAGSGLLDAYDRAAVAVVAAECEPIGLWRAWRSPRPPTAYPPPRRLYLVQTRIGEVWLAVRLQEALGRVGDDVVLVEVFDVPSALSDFSRRALDHAALLWADRPAGQLRLADTFDMIDSDGDPAFAGDRVCLSPEEGAKVAVYLQSGAAVWTSPVPARDPLHPGGPAEVPMSLLSDGSWIWSEAVGYYLTRYGIAPVPDLLSAVRAAGYVPPVVDAVMRHRGRAALLHGMRPEGVDGRGPIG